MFDVSLSLPDMCDGWNDEDPPTPLDAVEEFIHLVQGSANVYCYRVTDEAGEVWLVDLAMGPSVMKESDYIKMKEAEQNVE